MAEQVEKAAQRATDLTRQLLAFSRKGQARRINVDMHDLIADVLGLLRQTIDKRINLKLEPKATAAIEQDMRWPPLRGRSPRISPQGVRAGVHPTRDGPGPEAFRPL